MLEHFLEQAPIAAADDESALGGAMGDERNMPHHLMIEELVAFGGLDDAVERQHAPHRLVLEDDKILVLGLLAMDDPLHLEALAHLRIEGFPVPVHACLSRSAAPFSGPEARDRAATRPLTVRLCVNQEKR